MPSQVIMPKLSHAMTEGRLLQWLKKEGDRLQGGDVLASIETDKAEIELESFAAGVLRKILVADGETVPVGKLIANTAGTIAAAANGIGIVGVAPNVKIAGIKAGNNDGYFFPEAVICSFMWAGSHGIDVTNNSYFADPWLFNCRNDPEQRAIWKAEQRAIRWAMSQGVVVSPRRATRTSTSPRGISIRSALTFHLAPRWNVR